MRIEVVETGEAVWHVGPSDDELRAHHAKGLSDAAIARLFDCSHQTVRKRRRRLGLRTHFPKFSKPKPFPRDQFQKAWRDGETDAELAARFGVTATRVIQIRREFSFAPNRKPVQSMVPSTSVAKGSEVVARPVPSKPLVVAARSPVPAPKPEPPALTGRPTDALIAEFLAKGGTIRKCPTVAVSETTARIEPSRELIERNREGRDPDSLTSREKFGNAAAHGVAAAAARKRAGGSKR